MESSWVPVEELQYNGSRCRQRCQNYSTQDLADRITKDPVCNPGAVLALFQAGSRTKPRAFSRSGLHFQEWQASCALSRNAETIPKEF